MLKEVIDGISNADVATNNLVVVCATVIAMTGMLALGGPALNMVTNVVSGLMGIAVGKALAPKP